jgi:hypothetical protein
MTRDPKDEPLPLDYGETRDLVIVEEDGSETVEPPGPDLDGEI